MTANPATQALRPGRQLDRRLCAAPLRRPARSLSGRLALIAGLLVVGLISSAEAQRKQRVAILRGLDKVTARISAIEAQIDQPVRFGSLEITVRDCRTRPPEEPPETTAFLEVVELKPDEEPATIFSGWMFASSPALSAMEHPVYDVWVIDCTIASPRKPSGSE